MSRLLGLLIEGLILVCALAAPLVRVLRRTRPRAAIGRLVAIDFPQPWTAFKDGREQPLRPFIELAIRRATDDPRTFLFRARDSSDNAPLSTQIFAAVFAERFQLRPASTLEWENGCPVEQESKPPGNLIARNDEPKSITVGARVYRSTAKTIRAAFVSADERWLAVTGVKPSFTGDWFRGFTWPGLGTSDTASGDLHIDVYDLHTGERAIRSVAPFSVWFETRHRSREAFWVDSELFMVPLCGDRIYLAAVRDGLATFKGQAIAT